MAGLDNKLSNIIGTKLPQWLLKQIETRSRANSREFRDNDNILYLANKSAWVRLVSSIDLVNQSDLQYFKTVVGDSISKASDLAKQFVLFGGTSKYLNRNSYQLRSGLGKDGAYGILGEAEIQKYGYKPMPGITNVSIETQGRLGSVKSATINFRCWDKAQLDIIDALYFKLGFTMFLEWGNTTYYTSNNTTAIQNSELLSIDPFQPDISKEQIYIQIAKNSRQSEGNYDAMLGIVTNFTFTFNQEGGFDCQIRLMALGYLADSIKINNSGILPSIVEEEIKLLNNTLIQISTAEQRALLEEQRKQREFQEQQDAAKRVSILAYLNSKINTRDDQGRLLIYSEPNNEQKVKIIDRAGLLNSTYTRIQPIEKFDFIYESSTGSGLSLYSPTFGVQIPEEGIENFVKEVSINKDSLIQKINLIYANPPIQESNTSLEGLPTVQSKLRAIYKELTIEDKVVNNSRNRLGGLGIRSDYLYNFSIKYTGSNGRLYIIQIDVDLPSTAGLLYSDEIQPIVQGPRLNTEIVNKTRLDIYKEVVKYVIEQQQNYNSKNIELIAGTARQFVRDAKIPYQLINDEDRPKINSTKEGTVFGLVLKGEYFFDVTSATKVGEGQLTTSIVKSKEPATYSITITDTSLISSISRADASPDYLSTQKRISDQNQSETPTKEEQEAEKKALDTQIKEATNSQSALELTLRAIQLHALNKAINKSGIDIGKLVFTLKMTDSEERTFLKQIFSNGIFSKFIDELVTGNINTNSYGTGINNLSRLERLKIQSKYGFATSLMGDSEEIVNISSCSFETLLQAFVVPYQINQEIVKGIETNHPVYIPFGLLLMILNHSCTIYDSTNNSDVQTPIVYIDFNTEHNYFLSNTKQLSTNPWITLIPFEGGFNDYRSLFSDFILDGNNIKPPSGSTEIIPLFNPENQDVLSGQLPKIKSDESDNNLYRGRMMNILLNIDYLIKIAKDYSYRDGTNSIYLKEFIEQVLTDVNKYLGKINIFRLSYNDKGNTFQIVDDQFIPVKDKEEQVSPKDVKISNTTLSTSNTTELPLFGKYSIAKSLDIKSDVSSKLANMLAISANADVKNKATLSKNGDNFGYINTSYQDRFITNRLEAGAANTGSVNLDSIINSATQFNQTISDFYSKINPSENTVSPATNYYIEKMSKIKNDDYPTRASAMIPVSVNFTTDGISGFLMGQAFTIPDELLPYTYNARKVHGELGLQQDHINKVGFVVVGLNHILENNQWNTSVRANMIFLKEKTEFSGSVVRIDDRTGQFGENQFRSAIDTSTLGTIRNIPWSAAFISYVMQQAGVNFPSNAAHVGYLNSIRSQGSTSNFELLDPAKTKISAGDIVVFNRDGNNQTFSSNPYSGFSHGDIIISATEISAEGIGGNVSDTVFKTLFNLTSGRITNRDVFAIVRPKTKTAEIIATARFEYNTWLNNSWKESTSQAIPRLKEYYKVVNINIA